MLGFGGIARKIFGTQNDRELKSIRPLVEQINQFEPAIKALSDSALQAKTPEFKARLEKGETLNDILPEAFAVVREAAWRVLGQRHYDVQLIGGITLHRGRIAEMKTGEGKTLVATLPCYLNALSGKGVHVVTVNDYLARRDSEWMGRVYKWLGLSVGNIVHGLNDRERQENYRADITYGTNNEFGFDYLRDNMKFDLTDYVQRDLNFAIVDEVDSILIDEARTPLIISGPTEDSTDLYYKIDQQLRSDGGLTAATDYTVDEKSKTASLTEAGVEKMEGRLRIGNLYDPINIETLHHVNQALRAHMLFKVNVDYVIRDGQVLIVDEFTGRLMPGRRWSDGLHQAIEAKEGVEIENENQTLATITFQNYFRMYKKLSGMTGTADTEATEFKQIYKLDVTVIPTNRTLKRADDADTIFKSEEIKLKAIVDHIKKLTEKGQPVLVGTISVEKSEQLAQRLKAESVKHNVLNAKQHQREAEIIAQAGRKGAITISTNMAGRGTDILLGGNPESLARTEVGPPPKKADSIELSDYQSKLDDSLKRWQGVCEAEKKEVLTLGGLFIIGTERHESRRIDNQLRGRAGRQGDPGGSRFYLSLDDDLMRIFGGERIKRFMEDELPIEHRWINKAIENAQKKVEGHNYDIRKHLLQYDDVMNQQRQVVYGWRREVLGQDNLRPMVFSMVEDQASAIAEDFFPGGKLRKENGQAMLSEKELNDAITTTLQFQSGIREKDIVPFNGEGLKALIVKRASAHYDTKEAQMTEATMRGLERMILLSTIDSLWKDHLLAMDHLREGIGLRGYAQKDPLVEYKKEAFRFFEMMMGQITSDAVQKCFAVQIAREPTADETAASEAEATAQLTRLMRRRLSQPLNYNVTSEGNLIPQNPVPPPPSAIAASPGSGGLDGGMPLSRNGGGGGSLLSARGSAGSVAKPVVSGAPKVGRNDPCPCGSGKKYKKCHGTAAP